jgi:UDP-N-acetylmuramate dehydrogenase
MLEPEARQWLSRLLGANVRFDEPMAAHTSFRIGGPADAMVQPESETQLKEILQWRQQKQIPYLVIGGGTNLLVRDGGIRGLVIHLGRLAAGISWRQEPNFVRVQAGAGVPTRRMCRLALQQGWQSFNFALGIPGTLGGAILMNAGTARGAMADVLEAVTVMTGEGQKAELTRESFDARYRRLQLPAGIMEGRSGAGILLEGLLKLQPGDRDALRREAGFLMKQRAQRQPSRYPSAGCFFQNPSPDAPAGLLIDRAGLKGLRVGDAQISARHANFIVNLGHASAAEVLELADRVRDRIQTLTGVVLMPEVRVVGEEKTNP